MKSALCLEPTAQEVLEDQLYWDAGLMGYEEQLQAVRSGMDETQFDVIRRIIDNAVSAALRTAYRAGWQAGRDGKPIGFDL